MKKLKTKFEIEDHYEIIDSVGQGAYGIVVAAKDLRDGSSVAIKKIEKAFEHKIFTKRTLRELKICRLLKHENVRLFFVLVALTWSDYEHQIYPAAKEQRKVR